MKTSTPGTPRKTAAARNTSTRKPTRSTKITKVAGARGLTRKRDIFGPHLGDSGVRRSGRSATSAIP